MVWVSLGGRGCKGTGRKRGWERDERERDRMREKEGRKERERAQSTEGEKAARESGLKSRPGGVEGQAGIVEPRKRREEKRKSDARRRRGGERRRRRRRG